MLKKLIILSIDDICEVDQKDDEMFKLYCIDYWYCEGMFDLDECKSTTFVPVYTRTARFPCNFIVLLTSARFPLTSGPFPRAIAIVVKFLLNWYGDDPLMKWMRWV